MPRTYVPASRESTPRPGLPPLPAGTFLNAPVGSSNSAGLRNAINGLVIDNRVCHASGVDKTEWSIPLPYDPVVKLDRDGDNWIKLIDIHVRELAGSGSGTICWDGPGTYRISPEPNERVDSSLVVGPEVKGRPICRVVGIGEERPADVQLWTQAAKRAVKGLKTNRTFSWNAIIGQHPDQSPPPGPQVLGGAGGVGGILLRPSETPFAEVRGRFSAFGSGPVVRTRLVQASGDSSGYELEAALRAAGYDLNLLCALLSLVGGFLWTVQRSAASGPASEFQFPATPPGLET
jgi:hypothetical protein